MTEEWALWARTATRGYLDHPDYDDLLSEAYIASWRSLRLYQAEAQSRRRAIAQGAARKAAAEFLRSPRNRTRTHTKHGGQLPVFLDWSEISEEDHPWRRDFSPLLIEMASQ